MVTGGGSSFRGESAMSSVAVRFARWRAASSCARVRFEFRQQKAQAGSQDRIGDAFKDEVDLGGAGAAAAGLLRVRGVREGSDEARDTLRPVCSVWCLLRDRRAPQQPPTTSVTRVARHRNTELSPVVGAPTDRAEDKQDEEHNGSGRRPYGFRGQQAPQYDVDGHGGGRYIEKPFQYAQPWESPRDVGV